MAVTTDNHPSRLDQARGLLIIAFITTGICGGYAKVVEYVADQDQAEKARFYASHPSQAPVLGKR